MTERRGMVKRDDLTKFIYQTLGKDILDTAAKVDACPNSVQIRGKEEVKKVVSGVSLSLEFLEIAIAADADYIIVHHGIYLDGHVIRSRFEPYEDRLRLIFTTNLTLAGFHYALDAHPILGNNAQIIKALGAKRLDEPYLDSWGWVGEFKTPQDVQKLADKCATVFQHDVFVVNAGPQKIKRMGVCSGGAKPRGSQVYEIIDNHIDLHLTGEISESGPYFAEEGGYNYFSAGHYATEVFGVQALSAEIKKHYKNKLEVEFIDVPSTL
jgi:dinuclear metal center YbgI/SA1388 family protein